MRNTTRILFALLFTICLVGSSFSQSDRFPLEIIDLGGGPTAHTLIHEVKTEIAKSQHFRFTSEGELRLQLRFQASEVAAVADGNLTVYSIVFTLANSKQVGGQSTYLSQTVNTVRSDEIDRTAKQISKQTILARAQIQEMIVAILDGRIHSIVQSFSAN